MFHVTLFKLSLINVQLWAENCVIAPLTSKLAARRSVVKHLLRARSHRASRRVFSPCQHTHERVLGNDRGAAVEPRACAPRRVPPRPRKPTRKAPRVWHQRETRRGGFQRSSAASLSPSLRRVRTRGREEEPEGGMAEQRGE